jgi:hypothetical protein
MVSPRDLLPFYVTILLFGLLGANTIYFGATGATSKFVDAAAWLTLLALFLAETRLADRMRNARARSIVRALRLLAAAGVFAAVIGYVFDDNVLDAVNAALWIALVVLLELELRSGGFVERARRALRLALAAVYAGLAVLVVLWALRGMWLDAYDAVLWLAAFVLLEHDIAGTSGHDT